MLNFNGQGMTDVAVSIGWPCTTYNLTSTCTGADVLQYNTTQCGSHR